MQRVKRDDGGHKVDAVRGQHAEDHLRVDGVVLGVAHGLDEAQHGRDHHVGREHGIDGGARQELPRRALRPVAECEDEAANRGAEVEVLRGDVDVADALEAELLRLERLRQQAEEDVAASRVSARQLLARLSGSSQVAQAQPGKDQVDGIVDRLDEERHLAPEAVCRLHELQCVAQREELRRKCVSPGRSAGGRLLALTAAKKEPLSQRRRWLMSSGSVSGTGASSVSVLSEMRRRAQPHRR